jgi:hypothetical protein
MMSIRSRWLWAAFASICTYASFAGPAYAVSTTEGVSGTALSTLALAAGTGANFASSFAPGYNPTATGALTAVDTNPGWTLKVQDTASGHPGHMTAASTGCAGSDAYLTNPLDVTVTSLLGGVLSAGQVPISGTATTVASATNQLLGADVLTTNYYEAIPSTEVMLIGCVYSMTATYTLQ